LIPETGIDNCPSGRKKIYAPTYAARATGTKDGSVRATCPSGKNLVEVVTQTSWDGAKNAWTVQHVVFNDTLLLGGTKFTEAILSEATTFMYREQSVDNALQIGLLVSSPGQLQHHADRLLSPVCDCERGLERRRRHRHGQERLRNLQRETHQKGSRRFLLCGQVNRGDLVLKEDLQQDAGLLHVRP
jgi:hypothetical protein